MTKTKSAAAVIGRLTAGLAAVGLAIVIASPADAVSSRVRTACKDDYLRFCPNYEPDSTKARQCMRQMGKRLSPRCLDALADAGEIRRRR